MPKPNQDNAVSDTVASCHARVCRQIQPKQLKRIHEEWNAKKLMLRTWSIATGAATYNLSRPEDA
jgi:hypothetical protein